MLAEFPVQPAEDIAPYADDANPIMLAAAPTYPIHLLPVAAPNAEIVAPIAVTAVLADKVNPRVAEVASWVETAFCVTAEVEFWVLPVNSLKPSFRLFKPDDARSDTDVVSDLKEFLSPSNMLPESLPALAGEDIASTGEPDC